MKSKSMVTVPGSAPAPSSHQRKGFFDALRGIAILLVVVSHAATGVNAAGLVSAEQLPFFSKLTGGLYLTHLPLLALLMGINFPLAVAQRSTYRYWLSRVYYFVFLYLLWSAIQGMFSLLGSSFANEKVALADILNLAKPQGHLWFLPWAAIASSIALLFSPWKNWFRAGAAVVFTGLLAWYGWGINGAYFWQQGNALYIFLIVGSIIGVYLLKNFPERFSFSVLGLVTIAGIAGFFALLLSQPYITKPTSDDPGKTFESISIGISASLLGVVGTIALCALFYRAQVSFRWAENLGKKSLEIYLAHLLFVPTTRVVLIKMGLENPYTLVVLASLAGILGSLLLATISAKFAPWVFTPPALQKIAPKQTTHHIKDARDDV